MIVTTIIKICPTYFFLCFHGLDDLMSLSFVCKNLYCNEWDALLKFRHVILHRNLIFMIEKHFGLNLQEMLSVLHKSQAIIAGGSVLHLFTGCTFESSDLDIFIRNQHDVVSKVVLLTEYLCLMGYEIQFISSIRYASRVVFGLRNHFNRKRIEIIVHNDDDVVDKFDISVCMCSIRTNKNGKALFRYRDCRSITERVLLPSAHLVEKEKAMVFCRLNGTNADKVVDMYKLIERMAIRIEKYCNRGYLEGKECAAMRQRWIK